MLPITESVRVSALSTAGGGGVSSSFRNGHREMHLLGGHLQILFAKPEMKEVEGLWDLYFSTEQILLQSVRSPNQAVMGV